MKNIESENNIHKISFLTTALALSLTIQIFAQSAYPVFEEPENQSNIQTLSIS